MTRTRGWLVGVLALVLVVALGGAAWAVWGPGDDDGHPLVKYSDAKGRANRYVNLQDGRAQLSIGSPDSHRIVVQWRDPDGHGWTAPSTVWTDRKRTAVDNTVRYGGGTVAVLQVFTPDTSDDSDSADVVAGIVCADRRCVAERVPGNGGQAQVTPDGRTVLLGESEQGVLWWTARRGIHAQRWEGRPADEYDVRSTAPAQLAPDGSLRVVSAEAARRCTFELLTSSPGSTALSPAARRTGIASSSVSQCQVYFDTPFSPDWLKVHPDDHRGPDFWFIRRAGAWTTTLRDPSGLVSLERGDDCCSTTVSPFLHWNDLATGSPDGRRLQLQSHLLGTQTWGRPVLTDPVPSGYRCTFVDGQLVGATGYSVTMTCHSGQVRNRYRGDAYVVAVSTDLRHWRSRFVPGVHQEPEVAGGRLVVGDLTWSPAAGFGTP